MSVEIVRAEMSEPNPSSQPPHEVSCLRDECYRTSCSETEKADAELELKLEDGRGAAAAEETGEETDDDAENPTEEAEDEVENRGNEPGENTAVIE